jgi:hypothetical protein
MYKYLQHLYCVSKKYIQQLIRNRKHKVAPTCDRVARICAILVAIEQLLSSDTLGVDGKSNSNWTRRVVLAQLVKFLMLN